MIIYGKLSKALEYANSYKIPYVIFLGKDEVKKKKVKLRDMKTGKESLVSEKEVIKNLVNEGKWYYSGVRKYFKVDTYQGLKEVLKREKAKSLAT